MSVLEVRDLTVDYRQRGGGGFRAVSHCSFAIARGETLALVGESGSGKSTVVRTVGRLLRPAGGEVLLDGKPAGRRGAALRAYRRRVQLIFQDPFASLNPMHTVRHHLARPILMLHPGHSRARLDADVHELLRSVNLTPAGEIARSRPHELSGGQRQRVAIARALASGPEVLLADEPVSMLDTSIRLEILNLLDRLKRERNLALLYVTHDLATARHFSSRIMVMYRGEIVEQGPADEVILRPAHPYTQLLAAAAPDPGASRESLAQARRLRQEARRDAAAERREVLLDAGCRFRLRCPHAMEACAGSPPEAQLGGGHSARCWLYAQLTVTGGSSAPGG
ncbi:MAG: ABC transporter ATP-binding protein [Streptosporangiaceae bacterium]|nr:ABC transporter ATP-binding protein [Streptosporangiaceae bacterium]